MLEHFETFSVDTDIWASIRNVQTDFRAHVTDEIRKAVKNHIGCANICDSSLLSHGELIRFEGSDITHYAYRGCPLVAWTNPKMEVAGVTRVHLTYRIGVLPAASEDTKRLIAEAP